MFLNKYVSALINNNDSRKSTFQPLVQSFPTNTQTACSNNYSFPHDLNASSLLLLLKNVHVKNKYNFKVLHVKQIETKIAEIHMYNLVIENRVKNK